MIRNRIFLKSLAVFFMLEIFSGVILPSLSFALTSGPTSPEHTSFEPVDVTDMINVSTGDLVYNLPLFEVPGPAGGFPISMSYHAGIQPEVDASWVGLGWSLNPGAINRTVDGAPDDFSNVPASERTFWEGGTTLGLSSGVSFGNGAVTAGLSFASDTYRGMSVGANVSAGTGAGRASLGVEHTVDSYGRATVRQSAVTQSIYQARFDQLQGAYDRVSGVSSINSAVKTASSLLPVSYSSQTGKQGSIQSIGFNFNANIPIQQGIALQLGGLFKRYWTNEKVNSNTFGSIYFPLEKTSAASIGNNTYDINDLYYLDQVQVGGSQVFKTVLSKNPSLGFAGTFPTYDSYVVTGQGIGGTIRPYHLKANLYRATQRSSTDSVIVQPYPLGGNIKPTFRFVNDFSNSFLYDQDAFVAELNNEDEPLSFQFKQAKETTGDGTGVDGYVNGALAGSRSIKYFTKAEVIQGNTPGFIRSTALGYAAHLGGAPNEAVEGFKVTNESGVSYHYALPVYSYDEYSFTGGTDYKNKWSLNLFKRLTPYAYTWLLTAMTGPDYADTNQDGLANEGDTGYWITFEYGKWNRGYNWRNPSENFSKDLDRTFDFFSKGKKEIYYLNAIKSATHTALFVKELRRDGKGVVHDFEEAAKIDGLEVDDIDKGGYTPVNYGSAGTRHSTSTLRLKEILLLKNTDMPFSMEAMAGRGTTYNHFIGTTVYHHGANVLDVHDIADIHGELLQKSLRSVAFDHDYSLCPQTPNSFISVVDALNNAAAHLESTVSGKLTLNSVKMNGKNGVGSLPDIKFGYDLKEGKIPANGKVTFVGNAPNGVNARVYKVLFRDRIPGDLQPGDMVNLYRNGNETRCGVVLSSAGLEVTFQIAGSDLIFNDSIIDAIEKTKNPPYVDVFRDIWGFYKPDYVDYKHENISRMVSEVSARTTDAWSLRTIKTVTGAEINVVYESDTYDNSIKQISTIPIKSIEIHNSALRQVKVNLHGNNARRFFKLNDPVKINGVLRRSLIGAGGPECGCTGSYGVYFWARHASFENKPILAVGDNYIIVEENGLLLSLEAPNRTIWVDCSSLRETSESEQGRRYEAHSGYEFTGGDLQFTTNQGSNNLGGGVRVKVISVANDLLQTVHTVSYDYKHGVTPYEPLGLDVNIPRMSTLPDCLRGKETEAIDDYNENFVLKVAYRNMADLFANARLMPGPGVMYGQVNIRESTTQPDGKVYPHQNYKTYHFEVFNPKLIDIFNKDWSATTPVNDNGYDVYSAQPVGTSYGAPAVPVQELPVDGMTTNAVSIQDFSAVIGTMKSVATYDLENRKLSETSFHYLFDELSEFTFPAYRAKLQGFQNQGLIEEVFADARIVRNTHNPKYWLIGVLSKFSQFPGILVSTTSTNFKTGVVKTTRNVAYDFYSGQVVKTLTNDAFGNQFSTEAIPAYRKYSAMEPTVSGGVNMLVQNAGERTYKVRLSAGQIIHDGLLAAAVQTWSDTVKVMNNGDATTSVQPGIWRKHSSYSFIGDDHIPLLSDGTYDPAYFSDFNNWGNENSIPEGWQKNSSVRLYAPNSHALEARDINGNFASMKMSSDGTKVLATVANARYHEAVYSGAEDDAIGGYYGGKIARLDGTELLRLNDTDFTTIHTGLKALRLSLPGTKTFRYALASMANKTYHASVWVNAAGGRLFYKLNGVTTSMPAQPSESKKAGVWYLLELTIPAGNGALEVWCETVHGVCDFDDFRLHPINAAMVTYVYNKWDEVSHVLDNNNLYTAYSYDAAGKLIQTRKESFSHGVVKTAAFQYHYKNLQD